MKYFTYRVFKLIWTSVSRLDSEKTKFEGAKIDTNSVQIQRWFKILVIYVHLWKITTYLNLLEQIWTMKYRHEQKSNHPSTKSLQWLLSIHLGTKYGDFQEKIFTDISWKKFQTSHCIVVTLLKWKIRSFFKEIFAKIFSWKSAYLVPRCIQKGSSIDWTHILQNKTYIHFCRWFW